MGGEVEGRSRARAGVVGAGAGARARVVAARANKEKCCLPPSSLRLMVGAETDPLRSRDRLRAAFALPVAAADDSMALRDTELTCFTAASSAIRACPCRFRAQSMIC